MQEISIFEIDVLLDLLFKQKESAFEKLKKEGITETLLKLKLITEKEDGSYELTNVGKIYSKAIVNMALLKGEYPYVVELHHKNNTYVVRATKVHELGKNYFGKLLLVNLDATEPQETIVLSFYEWFDLTRFLYRRKLRESHFIDVEGLTIKKLVCKFGEYYRLTRLGRKILSALRLINNTVGNLSKKEWCAVYSPTVKGIFSFTYDNKGCEISYEKVRLNAQ